MLQLQMHLYCWGVSKPIDLLAAVCFPLVACFLRLTALQQGQSASSSAWLKQPPTGSGAAGSRSSNHSRTAAAGVHGDEQDGQDGGQLVSADYGYAVLGGVDPESSQQVAGAQQPKLHPTKNFDMREMYTPLVRCPAFTCIVEY